jgi:hypothetical protein
LADQAQLLGHVVLIAEKRFHIGAEYQRLDEDSNRPYANDVLCINDVDSAQRNAPASSGVEGETGTFRPFEMFVACGRQLADPAISILVGEFSVVSKRG